MGVGGFPAAPGDRGYRRGYLCGMIRGDGHLATAYSTDPSGTYRAPVPARPHGHRGARPTRRYLAASGSRHEFEFPPAARSREPMPAIRRGRATSEAIQLLIAWPADPSRSGSSGFLAGIFDAEGGCSRASGGCPTPTPRSSAGRARAFDALGFDSRSNRTRRRTAIDVRAAAGGLGGHAVLPRQRPGDHPEALDRRAWPSRATRSCG